jgi:hypothetical protein
MRQALKTNFVLYLYEEWQTERGELFFGSIAKE